MQEIHFLLKNDDVREYNEQNQLYIIQYDIKIEAELINQFV